MTLTEIRFNACVAEEEQALTSDPELLSSLDRKATCGRVADLATALFLGLI
jgi:hypothetical protein